MSTMTITDNQNENLSVNVVITPPIKLIVTDFVASPVIAEARVTTVVNPATITPDTMLYEIYAVTGLAQDLSVQNATGTNVKLVLRIKDAGVVKALTFGNKYRGIAAALPASTIAGKTLYLGFIYNAGDDKWDLVAKSQEL